MSTMLESLGIPVMQGYRPEHLEPVPDCVIVGNAIPRGNVEVEATLNRKLLYRSQAEVVKEEFMHYLPEIAIVNNIEFDHADIYKDLAAGKLAFRRLMNLVPGNGKLIAGWDSQNVREVVALMGQQPFTQLETFGTGAS